MAKNLYPQNLDQLTACYPVFDILDLQDFCGVWELTLKDSKNYNMPQSSGYTAYGTDNFHVHVSLLDWLLKYVLILNKIDVYSVFFFMQ